MADLDITIFQGGNAPQMAPAQFDIETLVQEYRVNKTGDWPIPDAFLCCILAAAAADNRMTEEERIEVLALSRRSKVLKKLSPAELAKANENVKQKMSTRPQAVQEACESLPVDMRLPLFAHCVDIVLADGTWHPAEAELLARLVGFMRLDTAEARRIIETMMVKNKY
jgi:uncharacterized tellurite resistance protein B-like protein